MIPSPSVFLICIVRGDRAAFISEEELTLIGLNEANELIEKHDGEIEDCETYEVVIGDTVVSDVCVSGCDIVEVALVDNESDDTDNGEKRKHSEEVKGQVEDEYDIVGELRVNDV